MDRLDRYTCDEALRQLDDFLDRELSPEEMARVQAHLDTCVPCTEQFRFERGVVDAFRRKLRRLDIPPGLRDRIVRRLDLEAGGG